MKKNKFLNFLISIGEFVIVTIFFIALTIFDMIVSLITPEKN